MVTIRSMRRKCRHLIRTVRTSFVGGGFDHCPQGFAFTRGCHLVITQRDPAGPLAPGGAWARRPSGGNGLLSLAFLIGLGGAVVASGDVICTGARPCPRPPVPTMACPLISADQAPTLDGRLDEPVWSRADLQRRFHRHYGGLGRPQEFRMLTDGEWLYVGFTARDPITAPNRESLALSIAPHKDSDQWVTFSMTLDGRGIGNCDPACGPGGAAPWRVALRQHADGWSVELAVRTVPVFGDMPSKGHAFDFNLARTRFYDGDEYDVYQQWSDTGTSSGARYRFGEVTIGGPVDRLPVIRAGLQRALEAAREQAEGLSAEALALFQAGEREVRALLAAAPGAGGLTTAAVRVYQRRAEKLERRLQKAVLMDRGVIVWRCNPMAVPTPDELPAVNEPESTRLDVRVLAGEWESAALVVSNLTDNSLDGQVLLTDFKAEGGAGQASGWEVLQVRTAPPYMLETGRWTRDPLPRLQEGDLFRVAPDANELLWLTFKSRHLAPGRYTATLIVRSLDDRYRREIELVLRVYPLPLGAEGRPWVNPWHYRVRGRDTAARAAHCRDYYINVGQIYNTSLLPLFAVDTTGRPNLEAIETAAFDYYFDQYLATGADMWLIVVYGIQNRLLEQWNQAADKAAEIELWSPEFNRAFARWVVAFRDYMNAKGLPPQRWAFYIRDEPPPGEWRREVIRFARQVELTAPEVQTYITLQIGSGDDSEIVEVARHVDIIQVIGRAQPAVMRQLHASSRLWGYSISTRGQDHFSHRRRNCWEYMRHGYAGTGFWVWEGVGAGTNYPMDSWREDPHRFSAVYQHHDQTFVPSLRTEAFREGVEDWKYLIMLDEAIAAAGKQNVDAALVAAAEAYRAGCLDRLTDPDSACRFRDAVRRLLLDLHVALGDVDPALVRAIETDGPG